MFHSLRARLIASYLTVVLLTLCIAGAGLIILLQDYQRGIVNQRLTDALGPANFQARTGVARGENLQALAAEIQDQVDPTWRVLFMDEQGNVLADSTSELLTRRLPRIGALQNLPRLRFATGRQTIDGRDLTYAAAGVGQRDNTRIYLVLATVIRPFIGGLEDLARPLFLAGVSAILVAIILGLVLARSISKPIDELTRATEAITRNKYETQIAEHGDDEVGRLAKSFNAMVRAVQHSHRSQKEFVANVSHELKTPLTSIQGFSQAIMEGATRDLEGSKYAARLIHEESQRMSRLVADLLTLARLDAGDVPMQMQTLNLADMLPVWLDRFQTRAQNEQISLTLALASPPPIRGDSARLEQVATNLVDNALKYNKPGGSVRVSVSAAQHKTQYADKRDPPKPYALLSVSDTGQGIPHTAQARLFERFYRADPARTSGGSGLGLAIVQEIVHAHGGEITVESQPGQGATFNIWLPAETL